MLGKKLKTLKNKCPTCSTQLQVNSYEGEEIIICPTCKVEVDDDEIFAILEEQKRKKSEKKERINRKITRGFDEKWVD